jgi:hypothetical protein
MFCRGIVYDGVDIIEKGGGFHKARKAAEATPGVLVGLMSRTHGGLEDIMHPLGSRTGQRRVWAGVYGHVSGVMSMSHYRLKLQLCGIWKRYAHLSRMRIPHNVSTNSSRFASSPDE